MAEWMRAEMESVWVIVPSKSRRMRDIVCEGFDRLSGGCDEGRSSSGAHNATELIAQRKNSQDTKDVLCILGWGPIEPSSHRRDCVCEFGIFVCRLVF